MAPEPDEAKTKTPAWLALGLTHSEYTRIVELLGREPNETELGIFSVLWSEHCGYKHSRPHLGILPTEGDRVIQGPGENAGLVDIGDGWAVALRIETHNHPSAIEPYQGAATGVGGIIRDILSMGARPVALMDSLYLGPVDDQRSRYLAGGIVAGIAGYGNCVGVPTVGGETRFSSAYARNPLVNVMCVGLVRRDRVVRARAEGPGNAVMLVGSPTGRDGIHGAGLLASKVFVAASVLDGGDTGGDAGASTPSPESLRPAVQVADPFMEKLVIEACLEALETGHVVAVQDLGAAGLSSSTSEVAARAGTGIEIDLSLVPRREENMTPFELMLSETQERMLLIVEAGHEEEVRAVFRRWEVPATVIGRVTSDGHLRVRDGDKLVADIPVSALTHDVPVYTVEQREPAEQAYLRAFDPHELPDVEPDTAGTVLLDLLRSPNLASKKPIWRQYDHMVQINTVVGPGADAALLRVKGTALGVAITTDGNGRYCYLDPYDGVRHVVAEAARNLVCTGAEPIGITDSLNFGDPDRPEVAWQFRLAVEGMAEACRELGIPVTGGNVSFYNETNGQAIYPTPVVGMVGVMENVFARTTPGFKEPGELVILLGPCRGELGGSEYLEVVHGKVAGRLPLIDLKLEKRVQDCALTAIRSGIVNSAHDCAEGGLGVALAECCLLGSPGARGVKIALQKAGLPPQAGAARSPDGTAPLESWRLDELLFGEAPSRIILTIYEHDLEAFASLARTHRVPWKVIGKVQARDFQLVLDGQEIMHVPTGDMERAWESGLAGVFGSGEPEAEP